MAKYFGFKGKVKSTKRRGGYGRTSSREEVERGLKTRVIALLMLILASSFGLWFAEFQPFAILLWIIVAFVGGYAVFEYELFLSKVFVVTSTLIMEFLVLDGVPNLFTIGSAGSIMMVTFGILDAVLLYALMKL